MSWWTRFLVSKVSGYLAIIIAALLSYSVWYIKDLKEEGAYCRGLLDAEKAKRSLESRVIDTIRKDTKDVVKELEQIRDEAEDVIEEKPEPATDEIVPPTGCAAERAPDAVLRYHGWLRDE